MRDLPRRVPSAELADIAHAQTETVLSRQGWVFRGHQPCDYGIDAEAELVDSGYVTGRLAKLQIKGVASVGWHDGVASTRVKVTTWNLWRNMVLPVVAILYAADSDELVWTQPLVDQPRLGAASVTLHFQHINRLPASLIALNWVVRSWHEGYEERVLDEVPAFGRTYQRLLEVTEFDWFLPLDEDLDDELRLFYRHLHRLRLFVGLNDPPIRTLDWWLIQDRLVFADDDVLHYGSVDYLVRYVTALYRPACVALAQRYRESAGDWLDRGQRRALDWIDRAEWVGPAEDPEQVANDYSAQIARARPTQPP